MTAQELKESGRRLFQARRYREALPLLSAAVDAFPDEEPLWQELVLAASGDGQHQQAVEFAEQAVRLHPRSDWLWRQLGSELTGLDRLDEAEKALTEAHSLNPEADWLWRYLAALHRKRKSLKGEIEALERLDALGQANATDLNQLGIAYHDHLNFEKAIEFYRRSADLQPDTAPLFNMGLVFNHPEISQDADAADAYRRALALDPNYQKARERLEATKAKLIPLAARALVAAADLVRPDEHFQFYLNPFEALGLGEMEDIEAVDVKAIQRAKKRLLQEIDLNNDKVSWLDDYALDKSRALALEDDLHDDTKRRYHRVVFKNQRLLRFLTRGEIEHYLYSDVYFPRETLELLDEEPEFRSFLSKSFAQQYNLVLTRAIERRALPVVEALFDGRRWVDPADEVNTCFKGAHKHVGDLVQLIWSKAAEAEKRKVDADEIMELLGAHSIPELFNLLPSAFRSAQTELVAELRSLAVSCYNEHDDAELSRDVLNICKRFDFRSEELNQRLEADFKAIDEIILKQRYSARRAVEEAHSRSTVGTQQHTGETSNKLGWGALIFVGIIVLAAIFSEAGSNSGSGTSPRVPNSPIYSSPSSPNTPASESRGVFRVPSYISAELDRDKQVIESEKAKVEQMASQMEILHREIEQKQSNLDRTSQYEVDEFNRMVDIYNGLLERIRVQDSFVNQLVESYNEKLRKYGQ